jgi:AraC-like DNA-binding protein
MDLPSPRPVPLRVLRSVEIHRFGRGTRCRLAVRRGSVVLALQGRCEWRIGRVHSLDLVEGAALLVGDSTAAPQVLCATDVVLLTVPAPGGPRPEACAGANVLLSPENLAQSPPLSLFVGLLREELSENGAKSSALATALARSFAVYLERAVGGAAQKQSLQQTVGDGRIWKAMTLMHADPAKRWTVEQLARAVALSRPVFARRFVENAGISPLRYLAHCRMELAAELLRSSAEGLAEVATRVGYDSEFAFGRAFKRHHGMSPGLFRRQCTAPARIVMSAAA